MTAPGPSGARSGQRARCVVITGATKGIGRGLAEAFLARGAAVVICGRDARMVSETVAALGAAHEPLRVAGAVCDVARYDDVAALWALGVERFGRIDVLVNNAGIMPLGIAEAFTPEQFLALLDTNLVGAFRVTQAVLPHMRQARSGRLVHVSSIAGRFALPFGAQYDASKFGLEALMEALGYEVAAFGIETVIVEPGAYKTNLFAASPKPERQDVISSYGPQAERCDQFLGGFAYMFSSPDMAALVDPAQVVAAFVDLVERAPGDCPHRVAVGLTFGLDDLNAAIRTFQNGALEALRVGDLAR